MRALFFYIMVLFAVILAGCADSSVEQRKTGHMDTIKKLSPAYSGNDSFIEQNKTNHMDSSKRDNPVYSTTDPGKVNIADNEWKKILPADVYNIAREKGTERAFTGKYWDNKEGGTYYCAACGNPLFNSSGKFESSCGWPSFFEPISKGSIIYAPDNSYGMKRTEVMCGRCKAHLGHVFEDGPPPTGLRYCINSVILDFEKANDAAKSFEKKKDGKE